MPYETKKQLRIDRERLLDRVHAAEGALRDAGYGCTIRSSNYWTEYIWSENPQVRDDKDAAKRQHEEITLTLGRHQGRTEALELVINALELREYKESTPVFKHGELVRTSVVIDTDRLKADLETAIRVREEKANAAAEQETADKVAKLANRPAFTIPVTGSYSVGFVDGGFDITAPRLADLMDRKDASFPKPKKTDKKSKGDKK